MKVEVVLLQVKASLSERILRSEFRRSTGNLVSLPHGRQSRNLTQPGRVQVSMRGHGLSGELALVLAGCLTAGCGPGAARTAAAARPHAAADRWRVVSYHGVHVETPAAWPVVDGMHAGSCGSPFPATPTVFTGPDDNPPLACPAPAADLPASDGAWLAPGARPPDAKPVTTGPHVTVLQTRTGPDQHLIQVWYRHVAIEIGIGPDPQVARKILSSIGFVPRTPDTRGTGHCARARGPARRPAPARLTRRMVIEQGDVTLSRPLPSERPVTSAAAAWQQAGVTSPFDRYRLLLVRYFGQVPGPPGPLPRSRTRNLKSVARSPRSIRRLRICWVVHGPCGCAVTRRCARSGGADLDHEQAVQAPQYHRAVRMEEVRGEHGRGLGVQQLPPGRAGTPLWCRGSAAP
jgi:hypothetical protein